MSWNLTSIISKVRLTTGRPDASMMSDATIITYINNYYQYVLPKELKIFWGYTYYNFFTSTGNDVYIPPNDITGFETFNPTVYADGFPMVWYLSPDVFYQDYPIQENKMVMATGDGSLNVPNFTIPAFPIIPGSLYISTGIAAQTVYDTPAVPFTGIGSLIVPLVTSAGSVNYFTGAVTGLTYISPNQPAVGANITESSQTYIPNRPQGILYFNNVFTVRPIPDNTYQIKMQGINVPKAFVLGSDIPFRADLGPLIAYGASLEIFADFNQTDQMQQIMPQYMRYKDISMQDTYEEYLYQRSIDKF